MKTPYGPQRLLVLENMWRLDDLIRYQESISDSGYLPHTDPLRQARTDCLAQLRKLDRASQLLYQAELEEVKKQGCEVDAILQ